jgi:putative SOS response-associated peptidase YedK
MPVILDNVDWLKWLGEEPATPDELLALLKPYPDEALLPIQADDTTIRALL